MRKRRHYIYPDIDSMVEAFVCDFERFLSESLQSDRLFHVALSGGSTPLSIFQTLRESTTREAWTRVHIYWGDERCVHPDDPESNYGNARRILIDPLGIPGDNIHRIRGEEDPTGEAERYGRELYRMLPLEKGIPVFDWIWLGLGEDGHTASIFPDQIGLWHAEEPCVVTTHPETGQNRISISGRVINAARRVSFLITGKTKSPVVNEIVMKEGRYEEYPATLVAPVTGYVEWFLDRDATAWLSGDND
jgi:6-phosphogluconolactonase